MKKKDPLKDLNNYTWPTPRAWLEAAANVKAGKPVKIPVPQKKTLPLFIDEFVYHPDIRELAIALRIILNENKKKRKK